MRRYPPDLLAHRAQIAAIRASGSLPLLATFARASARLQAEWLAGRGVAFGALESATALWLHEIGAAELATGDVVAMVLAGW